MQPSFGVDDTEFDRPIVDAPSAAGLLQQTDRLAGQHFADEDQPAVGGSDIIGACSEKTKRHASALSASQVVFVASDLTYCPEALKWG